MTRRTISDAEKAQNALNTVARQLAKARTRRDKAKAEHDVAQRDVTALERRHQYLSENPDLPTTPQVAEAHVE